MASDRASLKTLTLAAMINENQSLGSHIWKSRFNYL